MISVSITELLDFHERKGTSDDYAPSVRLGDLRALVAENAKLRAMCAQSTDNTTRAIEMLRFLRRWDAAEADAAGRT